VEWQLHSRPIGPHGWWNRLAQRKANHGCALSSSARTTS
jgi:hypothetical protein